MKHLGRGEGLAEGGAAARAGPGAWHRPPGKRAEGRLGPACCWPGWGPAGQRDGSFQKGRSWCAWLTPSLCFCEYLETSQLATGPRAGRTGPRVRCDPGSVPPAAGESAARAPGRGCWAGVFVGSVWTKASPGLAETGNAVGQERSSPQGAHPAGRPACRQRGASGPGAGRALLQARGRLWTNPVWKRTQASQPGDRTQQLKNEDVLA